MNGLLIGVRAVHFAAALLLFGTLAIATWIARPVSGNALGAASSEYHDVRRQLARVAGWSLVGAIASGVLWFLVQAAAMTGVPLGSIVDRGQLGTVLDATRFGRVSEIRLGLAVAVGVVFWFSRTRIAESSRAFVDAGATLLAGALLGSLAWTGHAAAEQGADQAIHVAADVVHLLAAGAWLGGLPPFVLLLSPAALASSANPLKLATRTTGRFSVLGLICVSLLVATGTASAWFTVGDFPALLGTAYGILLLVKIGLFGAMLAFAAVNRFQLAPRLRSASLTFPVQDEPSALGWLRRTAVAEIVLGLGIVIVVGALGASIPARHEQPVWPFAYTIDWDLIEESAAIRRFAISAGAAVVFCLAGAVWGLRIRRRAVAIVGTLGVLVCVAALTGRLLIPAHPTTYIHSPVPYAVASVARGASVFARNCAICHDPRGHGDGPAAGSLAIKPANLTEHAFHHRVGDLFWWVKEGIAGTPMPSFKSRLSDTQIWDVINFLRLLTQSEASKSLNASVDPWRAIVAPDFTFQIGVRPQESLKQQQGHAVLLVFFSRESSLQRLQILAARKPELDRTGVHVVAMPIGAQAASVAPERLPGVPESTLARFEPDSVATYLSFVQTRFAPGAPPPTHVEFLIDRQGYLRACWSPGMEQGWTRLDELRRQIEILNREEPHAPPSEAHVH
jgi:putative copper resistance protein D